MILEIITLTMTIVTAFSVAVSLDMRARIKLKDITIYTLAGELDALQKAYNEQEKLINDLKLFVPLRDVRGRFKKREVYYD